MASYDTKISSHFLIYEEINLLFYNDKCVWAADYEDGESIGHTHAKNDYKMALKRTWLQISNSHSDLHFAPSYIGHYKLFTRA